MSAPSRFFRFPGVLSCLLAALLALPLLAACGTPSDSSGTEGTASSGDVPSEDEILKLLEAGKGGFYWAVEEESGWTGEVTVYEAVPYEGDLWDELFSGTQIIYQSASEGGLQFIVAMDDGEYPVNVGAGSVEFYDLSEHPGTLDPETLTAALSALTGMVWEKEEPYGGEGTRYRCRVDGLPVSPMGRSSGPSLSVTEWTESIFVPFTLMSAAGSVDGGELIAPEDAGAICAALWQSAGGEGAPPLVLLDRAERAYYYNGEKGQLLPAVIVKGTRYTIDGRTGKLGSVFVEHLLDAQTGELVSGEPGAVPDGTGGGQLSAEDEMLGRLKAGESGFFWEVEEDFTWRGEVTVYEAVPYERDLWDELFSGVEIVSKDESRMTVSIDGLGYTVSINSPNSISFYNMPGHPDVLDPEKVMEALSDIIGMDWEMDETGSEEEIDYRCFLDGLPVSPNGYFVGEDYYCGPSLSVDERHESIYVNITLGAAAGTVDAGGFVTPEEVELICAAYYRPALEFGDMIVILDRVEHAYYYNAQQAKLLPAIIVKGTKYFISSRTGGLATTHVEHLIDAQTGELINTIGG